MNPMLLSIVTFLSGTLAVIALASVVFDLFLRERSQIKTRLSEEFHGKFDNPAQKSPLFKDLKVLAAETSTTKSGLRTRLRDAVEQSGLNLTPDRLLSIAAIVGALAGLLVVLAGGHPGLALVGLIAGFSLPLMCVQFIRVRRINKLRDQLPEAFELMSRAIRAGQTVTTAFQIVADDCEDPLAEEFACCFEQQNLGLPQEVALRDLARRTGVMEMQMFAVTLLVQRQSGGNPVEVLNKLADMIRKRIKLFGKVKALTGEGRMQALVLLVMPPLIFVALFVLNRSYIEPLMNHPEAFLGILVSETLGALWIRKIINFDY